MGPVEMHKYVENGLRSISLDKLERIKGVAFIRCVEAVLATLIVMPEDVCH